MALVILSMSLGIVPAQGSRLRELPAYLRLVSPYNGFPQGERTNAAGRTARFRVETNGSMPKGPLDVEASVPTWPGMSDWKRVAKGVRPWRTFAFKTDQLRGDDDVVYNVLLRVVVRGTRWTSQPYRMMIDVAPPRPVIEAEPLGPWASDRIIDVAATDLSRRSIVVRDRLWLCVDGQDNGSGVSSVHATLLDTVSGQQVFAGWGCVYYDFDGPGRYELHARVTDYAGNTGEDVFDVIVVRGMKLPEVLGSTPVPGVLDDLNEATGYRDLVNDRWAEVGRTVVGAADSLPQ